MAEHGFISLYAIVENAGSRVAVSALLKTARIQSDFVNQLP